MYFGNFRDYSVKIGKYKKPRMSSGKRRLHSVSGRLYDDSRRNASDVFRKACIAFYYFRSLPSTRGTCRSEYRHRTKCFKVHYTPYTVRYKMPNLGLGTDTALYILALGLRDRQKQCLEKSMKYTFGVTLYR